MAGLRFYRDICFLTKTGEKSEKLRFQKNAIRNFTEILKVGLESKNLIGKES